jgi:hypothetical protein
LIPWAGGWFRTKVTIPLRYQHINSIVTADAVREMRLKRGDIAAALKEWQESPTPTRFALRESKMWQTHLFG